MSERDDWISTLQGIIRRMEVSDVTELEVHQGELRLRLRRGMKKVPDSPLRGEDGEAISHVPSPSDTFHQVVVPLTGIYYSAPNPNSPPYVSEGDWVEPETVVGLVETMKVFNEVTADCRGRIVGILAKHGQLVHAADPIFLVDVAAAPDNTGEEAP